MSIGTTIKRLRKEKKITQELLAEYLGITSRAVSQWECDRTAPDISQLPALANIFQVSADVLLGIDVAQKDKRIAELLEKAQKKWELGYNAEAEKILRAGLKEFPDSYKIMVDLMGRVWRLGKNSAESADKEKILQETVSLGERILAGCTDDSIRHDAIQLLCYTYPQIGETDKAIDLANQMPSRFLSAGNLLCSIYTGTKLFEIKQNELFITIATNLHYEICYNNRPLDDGSYPYTYSEFIELLKKYLAILDIIFEDKNYGFCTQLIGWTHIRLAQYYMLENQPDKALESLQIAAKCSVWFDTEYNPEDKYTCLLLRGRKFGGMTHNISENDCLHQLKEMVKPVFDSLRETPEFKAVEDMLRPHAKTH